MTMPTPAATTAHLKAADAQPGTARLLDKLGGLRGLVEGGLPPVVFVAVNALAGLAAGPTAQGEPLWWALGAAVGTAVVLIGLRIQQGQSVKAALLGLAGLAVAAGVATWTGQARDFFLPGIYVDAIYAAAFAGSVLIGRPMVGYLYVALFHHHRDWRPHGPLRRLFTVATVGWSAIYAVRFAATAYLYRADSPELLAVAKLILGWPLTAVGVIATVAALRRANRNDASANPASSVAGQFR